MRRQRAQETGSGEGTRGQPPEFAGLTDPAAYPWDPSAEEGVRWVQTHLSHVFLTPRYAYKFRKPVRFEFVDFGERSERNRDCVREVVLNRRLAPDVYLGVARLERWGEGWRVGPLQREVEPEVELAADHEHCVVMRRLPEGRDALSLLRAGRLDAEQVERVIARLVSFHRAHALGTPAPFDPVAWQEAIAGPLRATLETLLARAGSVGTDAACLGRLRRLAERELECRQAALERRRKEGRAVDGHGDLHLQHIWFETDRSEPLLIDCVEFRADLRRIDAAADLAFLAMDLHYRGAGWLGELALARYAESADDYGLFAVVDLFMAYRAAVRAKVAALAAGESELAAAQREEAAQSARAHARLALRMLEESRAPALVLLTGGIGTGKSSLARRLERRLPCVVLSSDRWRRRLEGTAGEPAGNAYGIGAYTLERREQVYRELLLRAEEALRSGRIAVLDASFARRSWRGWARALARRVGAELVVLETRCSREEQLARLVRRRREGRDASTAGPELIDAMEREREPLADGEADRVWRIVTEGRETETKLDEAVAHLHGFGPGSAFASGSKRAEGT